MIDAIRWTLDFCIKRLILLAAVYFVLRFAQNTSCHSSYASSVELPDFKEVYDRIVDALR